MMEFEGGATVKASEAEEIDFVVGIKVQKTSVTTESSNMTIDFTTYIADMWRET